MTRVLFVNPGAEVGGAETNLINMLRYAKVGGYEPVGVVLPNRGTLADLLHAFSIPIRTVQYYGLRWSSPWRYAQTVVQLLRCIQELKADVIHLNHQLLVAPVVQAGLLVARPVICHIRNYPNPEFMKTNRRWLNYCSVMLTVSQAVLKGYLSYGTNEDRLYQIYDGIELDAYNYGNRKQNYNRLPGIEVDDPVIGYVGRLVPEKGIEDLIRSLPQVLNKVPNLQTVICGQDQSSGQYETCLKALVDDLALSDNVHFLGFRNDIRRILTTVDVLVIPSRLSMREGLPLTAVEGLASGCLIVATPNSGMPEAVHHEQTGFLVEPENPDLLAKSIIRALSLSPLEKQRIQKQGRSLVERQFTVQQQVCELGQLYNQIVNKSNGN